MPRDLLLRDLARLRALHAGQPYREPFPSLAVPAGYPSLSSGFAPVDPKRRLPADARRFPVGHQHKQGLELITPGTDLKWMAGRKS
jgi:hypothetical protein